MTVWTIANLERNLVDGGVTVAHWRVTEVDGDYSASAYGTVGITPDAGVSDCVPYDNLTESAVLGWVWAKVDQAETEAALTANIEAQKNPVTGSGMPW